MKVFRAFSRCMAPVSATGLCSLQSYVGHHTHFSCMLLLPHLQMHAVQIYVEKNQHRTY